MTATALLPAFLPTALPPPSTSDGSTTASSTVGDDMDGAMDRLSLDGNPQQQAQAQAQTPSQQQHPLPPRPQVSRGYNPYLGMPPYGGYGPPPPHHEPPWATAYPLPPAYSSHPTGDALGLHGPPGLVPQQPLYMTSATHAPTPYIARPHPFLVSSSPLVWLAHRTLVLTV
jgi:hypothetical protein